MKKLIFFIPILILLTSCSIFKKNTDYDLILQVNNNAEFNVKIINILDNSTEDLGHYTTRDHEITLDINKLTTNKDTWDQFLILIENEKQFGVGLYTYLAKDSLEKIPIKWLPSIALNSTLEKNRYTPIHLPNQPISVKT